MIDITRAFPKERPWFLIKNIKGNVTNMAIVKTNIPSGNYDSVSMPLNLLKNTTWYSTTDPNITIVFGEKSYQFKNGRTVERIGTYGMYNDKITLFNNNAKNKGDGSLIGSSLSLQFPQSTEVYQFSRTPLQPVNPSTKQPQPVAKPVNTPTKQIK